MNTTTIIIQLFNDTNTDSITTMIRSLGEFTRRTCTRMAGGCPGYGSGTSARGNTSATRSVVTKTKTAAQNTFNRSDERFRDEYYKFFEIAFE